jgi:CRP/FNR family transcriptional regulator, cyclic AMP receptor protein
MFMSPDDLANKLEWVQEFLSTPGQGKRIIRLKKHQILFSKGDKAEWVYWVISGQLKVTATSPQGKIAVHELAGANRWIAEFAMIGSRVHVHTAVATQDTDVTAIAPNAMFDFVHQYPDFNVFFLKHLANHLFTQGADLDDQLFNSADKRLARLLLAIIMHSKCETLKVEMTPTEMSELIGATRQTVHRILATFTRVGIITRKDRTLYLHRERLHEFALSESPGNVDGHLE